MEKWKNIKRSWGWLIKSLPKLLNKNGQYLYFGDEPECTQYSVCRARIGWRDCWIIGENDEGTPAYILECKDKIDAYVLDELKEFMENCPGFGFDWKQDDIYVCEHIMGQE